MIQRFAKQFASIWRIWLNVAGDKTNESLIVSLHLNIQARQESHEVNVWNQKLISSAEDLPFCGQLSICAFGRCASCDWICSLSLRDIRLGWLASIFWALCSFPASWVLLGFFVLIPGRLLALWTDVFLSETENTSLVNSPCWQHETRGIPYQFVQKRVWNSQLLPIPPNHGITLLKTTRHFEHFLFMCVWKVHFERCSFAETSHNANVYIYLGVNSTELNGLTSEKPCRKLASSCSFLVEAKHDVNFFSEAGLGSPNQICRKLIFKAPTGNSTHGGVICPILELYVQSDLPYINGIMIIQVHGALRVGNRGSTKSYLKVAFLQSKRRDTKGEDLH